MTKKTRTYNFFMVLALILMSIALYNTLIDKVIQVALCLGATAILICFALIEDMEQLIKQLEKK